MSYDSFDGGSHGRHDWVPIGYERVPQWEPDPGPTPSGNYQMGMRLPDKHYIIRACRLCAEVWAQEFKWAEAAA